MSKSVYYFRRYRQSQDGATILEEWNGTEEWNGMEWGTVDTMIILIEMKNFVGGGLQ